MSTASAVEAWHTNVLSAIDDSDQTFDEVAVALGHDPELLRRQFADPSIFGPTVDDIVAIWRALGEPGNLADWFSEPEDLPAV